jgi:hypothetical protein
VEVVDGQGGPDKRFHLPEPFSGRIESAPILFLSSNPSYWHKERYPVEDWSDELIVDFFRNRFGNGLENWTEGGSRTLLEDGGYGPSVAFWSAVRNRAAELLERPVRPGIDFALTEVVHCKSERETGVEAALNECMTRYLQRILAASGSSVIVVLGRYAKRAICWALGLDPDAVYQLYGPVVIGQRDRLVAFLSHPNAFGSKTFRSWPDGQRRHVQRFLRDFS